MKQDDLVWFARFDGIAWLGPFESQVEAWASTMQSVGGAPAPGATVWCEAHVKGNPTRPEDAATRKR